MRFCNLRKTPYGMRLKAKRHLLLQRTSGVFSFSTDSINPRFL
jgi:hypothetical protein